MSRLLLSLATAVALAGCGGGGEPAPTATAAPESTAAGPALNPFEETVVERLQVADPYAGRTEHGFKDAHAIARIEGDRVRIDIPSPRFGGDGQVRRTVRIGGIRTQAVAREHGGLTWRFRCAIKGFGDREVNLTLVSAPRRTIPAMHRLLRCGRG